MRLILIGAPGSGKGTQAELLVKRYGVPQIATGDIVRAEIAAETPVGLRAKELVHAGLLIPDDVMLEMVRRRLQEKDAAGGFVLDGFPRSIPQAEGLDGILAGSGKRLDAVIKIDVPKKILFDRMTGRRICSGCNGVYNLAAKPPRVEGKCDQCGGALIQRADDTEETVRKRLHVYESTTAPLIDFYDAKGLLVIAHGEGKIADVAAEIERGIRARTAPGR